MTAYKLSQRSIDNLQNVHPDLVACVVLALYKYTWVDFAVIEGVRSKEKQKEYFEEGASWRLDSRHLLQADGTAHAVDLGPIVNGQIPWKDWAQFAAVDVAMQSAAKDLGIDVKWGGDWGKKDGPHFQIKGKR